MIFCSPTVRTWPAAKGSIMPAVAAMWRIQVSDLMLMRASALLDDDVRKRAATIAPAPRQGAGGMAGHLDIGGRARRARRAHHRGRAAVRLLPHPRVQRKLSEQLHAVLCGHARAAAGAEDVLRVSALRAHIQTHVLHDAKHRYGHLLEHG